MLSMYTVIRIKAKLKPMMHWFRRKLKPIARGLLAVIASLWLVAEATPCVMAQPCAMAHDAVHCPMQDGGMNKDAGDCGPVTMVSCQMPDINSPATVAFGDMAVTPVLLVLLPVVVALPDNSIALQHDFFSSNIPAPPLRIQYQSLLI